MNLIVVLNNGSRPWFLQGQAARFTAKIEEAQSFESLKEARLAALTTGLIGLQVHRREGYGEGGTFVQTVEPPCATPDPSVQVQARQLALCHYHRELEEALCR